MPRYTAPDDLQKVLAEGSTKVRKPKSSVLFRRGEKASACSHVLRGKVTLTLVSTARWQSIALWSRRVGGPAATF